MTLFESCNNNSFECGANITIAVLSFLVIFLNLYYFLKTWRSQHFLTYEMFAILTATLDGLFLVLHELLLKDIIIILISNYLELLLFSIINFCFVKGFFILVFGETFKSQILHGIFSFFWIILTIILILGFIGSPPFNCYERFSFHWLFFSVCSMILALNSFIFGILLTKVSLAKEKETTNRESKDIQGQYFFSQQRKILVSLSVTFVLAIIVSFAFDLELKNMMTNKEIYCENSEKLVMNNYKARVINFLRILAWILPLVMLPISIYVIPYIDEKKWRTESTGIVFDNMDLVNDNSFLGYGNKFAGLHRDTILFNRSNISKSISIPSVLSVERQKSQILQVDNKYHQISSLGVKKVKSLDKE